MFKSAARLSTGDLLVEGWFAGAPYKSKTFFLTMLLPDSRGPRTTADGQCSNGLESFGPTKNAFPLIRKMAVSGAIGGEMRGSRHQTWPTTIHHGVGCHQCRWEKSDNSIQRQCDSKTVPGRGSCSWTYAFSKPTQQPDAVHAR